MKTVFRVPQRIHHGLILVTRVAERHGDGAPVSLEEVAKMDRISQGFLEEIAASLRSADIIRGRRGAGGGYVLGRNPEQITVADVVTAIEGPVGIVDCLGQQGACVLEGKCTSRDIWSSVQQQLMGFLAAKTIADVIHSRV